MSGQEKGASGSVGRPEDGVKAIDLVRAPLFVGFFRLPVESPSIRKSRDLCDTEVAKSAEDMILCLGVGHPGSYNVPDVAIV